jgi:hypothetical protein
MSAPGQSSYDGNPNVSPPVTTGYRPSADDFNGAACEDDTANPPDPQTMATAECWNTICLQLVSVCKMIPSAIIAVTAGATPSISAWATAANNVVSDPFTLTRDAAGSYHITWAAGLLPVAMQPEVALNITGGAHNYGAQATNITNGVAITTQQDGVLTDLNFQVKVY